MNRMVDAAKKRMEESGERLVNRERTQYERLRSVWWEHDEKFSRTDREARDKEREENKRRLREKSQNRIIDAAKKRWEDAIIKAEEWAKKASERLQHHSYTFSREDGRRRG